MKKYISEISACAVLLLLAGFILAILANLKPTQSARKEPSGPAAKTQPVQESRRSSPAQSQIPPEQYLFWDRILMPCIHEARQTYPVLAIRQKVDAFMARIQSGEVRLNLHTAPAGNALAAANAEERDPYIMMVFMPAMINLFTQVNGDQDSFQDEVVAIFLHEEYHLNHHMAQPGQAFDHHRNESEAWWWTIEQVYLPMIHAGRLKMVDDTVQDAINAYREARGNPEAPCWKRFIEGVIAPNVVPGAHPAPMPQRRP